ASGAVPDRAPAAAARLDGLSLPAAGHRGDNISQGLSRPSYRRLVVSDTPQLLLAHHLKALSQVAQRFAARGVPQAVKPTPPVPASTLTQFPRQYAFSFVAGKVDVTFPYELTPALMRD